MHFVGGRLRHARIAVFVFLLLPMVFVLLPMLESFMVAQDRPVTAPPVVAPGLPPAPHEKQIRVKHILVIGQT
jgi:hypothetical protein